VLRFAKPVSKGRLGLLDNASMVQAPPFIRNCFLGEKNLDITAGPQYNGGILKWQSNVFHV